MSMNQILAQLGIPTAFDSASADFSKMAQSSYGNIYIGDVLHKTFISVDERGTKAGAATKVEMKNTSALISGKEVILDRPFVYMILGSTTNLPVFIGNVMDIQK